MKSSTPMLSFLFTLSTTLAAYAAPQPMPNPMPPPMPNYCQIVVQNTSHHRVSTHAIAKQGTVLSQTHAVIVPGQTLTFEDQGNSYCVCGLTLRIGNDAHPAGETIAEKPYGKDIRVTSGDGSQGFVARRTGSKTVTLNNT